MQSRINRRDFLKLGMLALSSLAFRPYFKPGEPPPPDLWGRVTIEEIDVYVEPRSDVSLIVGKRYRDQLVVLYNALNAPDGPHTTRSGTGCGAATSTAPTCNW